MLKQLNRTLVEPFEIPSRTAETKESFTGNTLTWDKLKAKSKTIFSKELVFMLSVSAVWFFAFFYFVLYVWS
jgi:hypothetical protein